MSSRTDGRVKLFLRLLELPPTVSLLTLLLTVTTNGSFPDKTSSLGCKFKNHATAAVSASRPAAPGAVEVTRSIQQQASGRATPLVPPTGSKV